VTNAQVWVCIVLGFILAHETMAGVINLINAMHARRGK
jgi:hypothetical protein